MKEFQIGDRTISGYLAVPRRGSGPGVLVLHAWWGLTKPFQQVCDQLADAGFVAFAPDLYRGKTTTSVEEAEVLARALGRDGERVNGDIAAAIQILHQHTAAQAGSRDQLALIGFSLGGAYVLETSVTLAEEVTAVVIFYATYSGLDFGRANAAYLCHFAEDDPFEPAESVTEMQQEIQAAGRPINCYTYPGTRHWFFEENRPEYDAQAAHLAWERTVAFLHQQLA